MLRPEPRQPHGGGGVGGDGLNRIGGGAPRESTDRCAADGNEADGRGAAKEGDVGERLRDNDINGGAGERRHLLGEMEAKNSHHVERRVARNRGRHSRFGGARRRQTERKDTFGEKEGVFQREGGGRERWGAETVWEEEVRF